MNKLKGIFRLKRHPQPEAASASTPKTTRKKITASSPQTSTQEIIQQEVLQNAEPLPPPPPEPDTQQPTTTSLEICDHVEKDCKRYVAWSEGRSPFQPDQLYTTEFIKASSTQKFDYLDEDNQSRTEVEPSLYDNRAITTPPTQAQPPKHDLIKDALKVAKSGFTLALELTSKALQGLPIPGAKAAIDITLQIMKGIDVTIANMGRVKQLQQHITYILHNVLSPLSDMANEDIPLGLRADVEKLSIQLKTLMEDWASFSDHFKIRYFVQAKDDEDGLKRLCEDMQLALEKFLLSCQVRGQISNTQQEKLLLIIAADKTFEKRSNLVTKLPRAAEAGYNSGYAGGPTSCFEGTRTAILETIKSWVTSQNESQPRLFWLNGMAGIGKSTVAKTIAEYADNRGILGGSFFFSRDNDELRKSSLVFPTFAYQLAQSNDIFKSSTGQALQRDADFGYRSRQIQLEELIIRPLIRSGLLDHKHIVLLVIDALDECGPEDEAAEILQLLLAQISLVPFAFRVLLTSRPEHHIRNIFDDNRNHTKYILHDIEDSVVRSDIYLYVKSSLQMLPKQLKWPPKGEWPPKAEMEALVEKSGKLFVYAATSLRFIGNTRVRNPRKQLEVLLGARAAINAKPYAQLDQLYLRVLRNALPEDTEEDLILRFHRVVGSIVLLRNPLSIKSLACFIKYEEDDVSDALYHLHSIILTPPTIEEAPRIYHPSFPDFITNASRCSDPTFLVDIPTHEKRLVLRCLETMLSTLKRDILEVEDYFDLNEEINSLSELITEHVPDEVRYSCRHWASHLTKVPAGDEKVAEALTQFAFRNLLNWLEIMSLLGLSNVAVSNVRDAYDWAVRSKCDDKLTQILYDGYRLIFSQQEVISISAMHVYRTALPFTPRNSLLFTTYEEETDKAVRVMVGVNHQWSSCLSAITCGTNGANAVAYSSEGSRIATGNMDGRTAVWDAISASRLLELDEPDRGEVTSVSFLSNDSRLVSGFSENTITLWDVISGAFIRAYEGHTNSVSCLFASSMNPHTFVSCAMDGTIRIWDAMSENCTLIIQCHDSPVFSVALLPDDTQILSGSEDGVVRLWSRNTGAQLKQFELHTTAVLSLAVNNSDGLRFASASEGSGIKICNLTHGGEVAGHDPEDKVHTIAFSPDGRILAYTGQYSRNVLLWDCSTRQVSMRFRNQGVRQLAFNPQGTCLASVSIDCTCRLWDVTHLGNADDDSVTHLGWVTAKAFSEDVSWLATGGDHNDKTVHLWDSALGAHARALEGHQWGIYSLAFSPDNRFLASGSGDCTVRIWDVKTGQTLLILQENNWVKAISFSDEVNQVITRTSDFTKTWDIENALPTALTTHEHEHETLFLTDSISCVDEKNPDAPSGIGGYSDGFHFWLNRGWWMLFGPSRMQSKRAMFIFQEYQICGFALHRDRAVLVCVEGQVSLLDLSRMTRECI